MHGAEEVPEQREGDPPRIEARNLYEYRHMQRVSLLDHFAPVMAVIVSSARCFRPTSRFHTVFQTAVLPAAVFNPDYIKWVGENIREIDYVRKPGAMSLKWDTLTDGDLQESPVVVMVTQTTVSRCDSS